MTVMFRLSKKNILSRERHGLQYEYWLTASQENVPSFFKTLRQKVFGLKTPQLVSYLLESQEMSDQEFEEIEKLIQNAKENKRQKNS